MISLLNMKIGIRLAFIVLLALAPVRSIAQGDGPRAYLPVPGETNFITMHGISTSGNQSYNSGTVVRGGDIDVSVGVLQYARAFDIWGKQGGVLAVLPVGKVEGNIDLPMQSRSGDSSGLGDIQLGFAYSILGAPYLTQDDYAQFDPGFVFSIVGKLLASTGEYDSDHTINLGTNRNAVQILFPTAWYFT